MKEKVKSTLEFILLSAWVYVGYEVIKYMIVDFQP